MTKLKTTLLTLMIAAAIITGGFVVPQAHSTGGGWGYDDDDCDDGYHWGYGNNCDDDDDCDDDDWHHGSNCDDEPKTAKITVNKAITNDNGGNAMTEDFTITLTNVKTGEEFILVHDQDDSEDPSINKNEIPVGKYKITETISDQVEGSYTTVLIAGDTKCPSMLGETFKIKKGKDISCTIYSDDNGTSGSGNGIIFRNFSMQVMPGNKDMANSCDAIENPEDKNACIEIVDPSAGRIAIVDSALTSDTTIVLFSITEANKIDTTAGAITLDCSVEGIAKHNVQSPLLVDGSVDEDAPDVFPTDPSTNNVVVAKCGGMISTQVYNVNYIMIDPTL